VVDPVGKCYRALTLLLVDRNHRQRFLMAWVSPGHRFVRLRAYTKSTLPYRLAVSRRFSPVKFGCDLAWGRRGRRLCLARHPGKVGWAFMFSDSLPANRGESRSFAFLFVRRSGGFEGEPSGAMVMNPRVAGRRNPGDEVIDDLSYSLREY